MKNEPTAEERSHASHATSSPTPRSAGRKERAVLALARGDTQVQAARFAGISDRTIRRYLDNPEFERRVAAARTEIHDHAMGRLVDAAARAVEVHTELMNSSAQEAIRLRPAGSVLKMTSDHIAAREFAERFAQLEGAMTEHMARIDQEQP